MAQNSQVPAHQTTGAPSTARVSGLTVPADSTPRESTSKDPVADPDLPPDQASRAMDRRINRKLDLALLPMLSLLYLFNGLDRSNVGNAQTQGFTNDIGASPDDLNFAVSLFFVTFVTFQPFSAAAGRWLGPKYWMPLIMFGWGLVTLCQCWIHGRGQLVGTRLLIGALEAGFYPTAIAYLAAFYTRYDLALRIGIFFGQYAIASAFSGAIAYGVFHITSGPLHPWQYLFLLEGSLTCMTAVVAILWLPSSPAEAWFLQSDERRFATRRMRHDAAGSSSQDRLDDNSNDDNNHSSPLTAPIPLAHRLTGRDVVETLRDWKLWALLPLNICASVPSQAFSVFLPLVVQGMGYTALQANLMSVPPALSGAAGLYLFALSSDRRRERGLHCAAGILLGLAGLLLLVVTSPPPSPTNDPSAALRLRYAGLCLFLAGAYVAPPLTMAWLSGNTPGPGKRALVLGANGWGNLAGVVGAQLYRPAYAPRYLVPLYATLGFVAVALVGYVAYRAALARVNRRRRARVAAMGADEVERERRDGHGVRYGDRKWTFVYGL